VRILQHSDVARRVTTTTTTTTTTTNTSVLCCRHGSSPGQNELDNSWVVPPPGPLDELIPVVLGHQY